MCEYFACIVLCSGRPEEGVGFMWDPICSLSSKAELSHFGLHGVDLHLWIYLHHSLHHDTRWLVTCYASCQLRSNDLEWELGGKYRERDKAVTSGLDWKDTKAMQGWWKLDLKEFWVGKTQKKYLILTLHFFLFLKKKTNFFIFILYTNPSSHSPQPFTS